MYHSLVIHASTGEFPGCLQVLVIRNTNINIHVQVFAGT